MKLFLHVVPVICLLAGEAPAAVVFQDDFNHSDTNQTVIGNNWAEVNTGLGDAVILTNQLVLKNGATAGRTWVAQSFSNFSSPFTNRLHQNPDSVIWNFNLRSGRGGSFSKLTGFDASQYGIACVLAASSGNFLDAGVTGYAVVWGKPGGITPLRLVRFTDGLTNNATLTDIIVATNAPFDNLDSQFLSVRVIYDPAGESWELWARDDGSAFADPGAGTFTRLGQETDNTYTAQAMGSLGALWNYSAALNQYAYYDNFSVQVLLRPPFVLAQPQNQLGTLNQAVSLNVGVAGARPLKYQWLKNGNTLGGATNATLVINSFQLSDEANYRVVVTNNYGSTTSAVAVVTVNRDYGDAPAPNPTLLADNGARHIFVPGYSLGSLIDGEPNGQPDIRATGDDLSGANDDDGIILTSRLVPGQTATVQANASTNGYLNGWIDFNQNGSWADGGEQVFANQALSPGVNNLNFSVPVGAVSGTNAYARFRFSSLAGLSYTGDAPDGEVEDYQYAVNSAADLSVSISVVPNPVAVGSNLTWTVTVSNRGPSQATGVAVTNILPASVSLVSATSSQGSCGQSGSTVTCNAGMLLSGFKASMTIVTVPTIAATIVNTASAGGNESDPDLSNNSAALAAIVKDLPVITAPPQSLTVTNGNIANFSVAATGTGTLLYQWRFNGTNLSGRTNPALVVSNAQPASAGPYDVIVSDDVGYAISAPALLTVLAPPGITNQPQDQTGNTGGYVIFNVGATGTPPLNYQWRRSGTNLMESGNVVGVTSTALRLNNLQASDGTNYTVLVNNNAGAITSSVARLTVAAMDFGDATTNYPTLLSSNGARHIIVPGIFLGTGVSADADGKASTNALGDDLDDGITFTNALVAGQIRSVKAVCSRAGYVNAWIDFSRDGSWAEPTDQIFSDQAVVTGTNTLSFEVPYYATAGTTFARFRFTTNSGVSFDGMAANGEVEDYQVTNNAAVATQLVLGAQLTASVTAGEIIDPPPQVYVADNRGNPVFTNSTTVVTVARLDGSGTLQGTLTAVADHGVATFTNLFHAVATNITLRFTATSLASATSTVVTVYSAPAHHLAMQTQPSSSVTAGVAFPQQPVIRVEDQYGNLADDDNGRAITATRNLGNGTLQGNTTAITTNGLVTYSGLSHIVANTINVQFSAANLGGMVSSNILVNPATATLVGFTTSPGNAAAGATFGIQPVVKTQDQYGNNSTVGLGQNKTVALALTSGTGPLQGNTSLNIGAGGGNGIITFTDLRLDVAGTNKQLTASTSGFTSGLSSLFTVSAGTASKLVLVTPPSTNATAGAAFAQEPVVRVEDVFGNLRVGDNSTLVTAARNAGSGTLQGTTNLPAANGLVIYTNLSHLVATNIAIQFTSGSLSSVTSSVIVISPAAASQLTIATPPSTSATAGAAFAQQPVIRVEDAYGNLRLGDSNVVVSAARLAGSGTLQGTTSRTSTNGLVTFTNLAHTVATNITLQFTSGSLSNATSSVVIINPAAANKLTLAMQPSSTATIGVPFAQQPVVRMEDIYGNLRSSDTGIAVTATRAAGSGTLQGTTTINTTAGIATYTNLAHNAATNITIQFTSGGLSNAVSSAIGVSAGSVAQLVFLQPPTNAIAGAILAPAVTVEATDSVGQKAAGAPVALNLSSGSGTLGGTTLRTTDGNGLATFNDLSINFTGGKRLTAVSGESVSVVSSLFTIDPSAPTSIVFVQQPTNATAGAVLSPVVTLQLRDIFGNTVSTGGVSVAVVLGSGMGVLIGATNQLTDASGVASFTNLSLNLIGNKTLTASSAGLGSISSDPFAITSALASQLAFTQQPGAAVVGAIFGVQPVIVTQDAFGNGSTVGLPANLSVIVALTNGGGLLLGTTTLDIGTSVGNGTTSYSDLEIDSSGSKQLVAAAAGFASVVSDVFNAAKGDQAINFGSLSNKSYGAEPFVLLGTASSGLPVQFSVVAGPLTITSNVASIIGTGDATIRASQPGDVNFNPATPLDQAVTVARAELSITADSKARAYGSSNPPFTGTLTGVQYSDNITSSYSTTATQNSSAGIYSILPAQVDPDNRQTNYNITLNNGTLTVTNSPPIIITGASFDEGGFALSFIGQSGLGYAIECKTSLLDAAWITLTNVVGTGTTLTQTDPAATNLTHRFYRIRLQ